VKTRLGDQTAQLYQASGCDDCYSDGFGSLTCLPEIMTMGRELSSAIAEHAPAEELESLAAELGMTTLAESAALRVFRGETTAYEANRAVSDPVLASLVTLSREADTTRD
jgi:type II secretory ATPase GspE/PulE/Tfp pilus assembly ATPase PilB-like protein